MSFPTPSLDSQSVRGSGSLDGRPAGWDVHGNPWEAYGRHHGLDTIGRCVGGFMRQVQLLQHLVLEALSICYHARHFPRQRARGWNQPDSQWGLQRRFQKTILSRPLMTMTILRLPHLIVHENHGLGLPTFRPAFLLLRFLQHHGSH